MNDIASFEDKFLKKNFMDPGTLTPMACRKSKVLQLAKKPKQDGKSIAEAAIFDGPQGWSYTYSAAKAVADQADRGASDYGEFVSNFGRYHGHVRLDAFDVAQGQTNRGAYLRQMGEAMTSAVKSFGSIAARKVMGPVGGAIGRISDLNAGGTDGEILLTVRGDTLNFSPGMILMAADGTGNGAPSNVRSGLGYVIAINPDGFADTSQLKVATSEANRVAGTAGNPGGDWADNDYLFRNGDVAASTDLSDSQIRSLQGWITLAAAEDTYNGVTRSQDSRLSGNRLAALTVSGLSITDRCLLLVSECNSASSAEDIDYIALGPRTYQQLLDEARTYGRLEMGKTKLGISAVMLQTVIGEVAVIGDSHVRESDIWAITSDSLRIYNSDGFPALDVLGGGQILKSEGSAGYFIRFHAFTSLTVNGRPWDFGRCDSGNS